MYFIYDATKKLDIQDLYAFLNKFVGTMRQSVYEIYIPGYVIYGEISNTDSIKNIFSIEIALSAAFKLKGEIIIPCIDNQFKSITGLREIFPNDHYRALIFSDNSNYTINKICYVTNLVSRIDNLKIFI